MPDKAPLPELLAPCGSYAAVRAAVYSGADAVYLGGKRFNARINAKNFDDSELCQVIAFCHGAGVRVYVTLNTMLYDRELPDALRYAEFLCNAGADAVIAADMGLIALLRERLPELPVHTSTQAAVHSLPAIKTLAELGVARAVVARELPKSELDALCKASPIELEMFVHGALCVSCSGQCLLSAVMGGRSGNRGECAQPCRLSYGTQTSKDGRNGSGKSGSVRDGYPISLRDLCLAGHMAGLISSGIASLKIEGRMKSPEYVAGVTRIYRSLLDGRRDATESEVTGLRRIFSRGGFTDAYYTGAGVTLKNMLGTRSEGDKAATRAAERDTVVPAAFRKPPITVARGRAAIDPSYRPKRPENGEKPINIGIFRSAEQVAAPDFFDVVLLPPNKFERGTANGVALPPVIFGGELEGVKKQLDMAKSGGAEYIMAENVGQLGLAEGFHALGGARLNVANTAAAEFFGRYLDGIILSPELILLQIRDIAYKPKGAVVYGRLPLMTFARRLGNSTEALRDRSGAVFPVLPSGTRDILYNSVPVYMADRQEALDAAGIALRAFVFTTETRREVESVMSAYKNKQPPANNNIRRIKHSP